MPESSTVTFVDVVKKIRENPMKHTYTVIFKRQAAFYHVEERNSAAVEALIRSANGLLRVTVVYEPESLKILEATLVA